MPAKSDSGGKWSTAPDRPGRDVGTATRRLTPSCEYSQNGRNFDNAGLAVLLSAGLSPEQGVLVPYVRKHTLNSNMIIPDIDSLRSWQRLNLPGITSEAGSALMRALLNCKDSCLPLESFYRVCNIETAAVGEALSNFLAQGLIEIRHDDQDGTRFNIVPTDLLWARLAHYCAEMTTLLAKHDRQAGDP